jgi:hypothetical protein
MADRKKELVVVLVGLLLLGVVGLTFWREDWRYSLPTPRPKALVQPKIGAQVLLTATRLPEPPVAGRAAPAVFLHFFNPECPCSRFNLDHVRQLASGYEGPVRFVAIVQAPDAPALQSEIRRCRLPMQTVVDGDGRIARACDVYSTPQAVLLDRQGRLYYRGNYNATRYCDHAATEYARIALDSLLAGHPPPALPASATVAYGCPLPSNLETGRPRGSDR